MKTASLTYPPPRLIDTAPLAARYDVLTRAILAFIAAGQMSRVLRLSRKVVRLVRVFTALERENVLLRRKLAMLTDKSWRERVLKDLGGLRKLGLWEAATARIEARLENPPTPARLSISEQTPDWLLTPERLAESERLKAHARNCKRASAHPLIFRDHCKMDFDGLFRLAPLPRGVRIAGRVRVYTQNSIVDYEWNPIPYAKVEGVGPASLWPAEFYAAEAAEAAEREVDTISLSSRASPKDADGGSTVRGCTVTFDPPSSHFGFVRDDKDRNTLTTRPLRLALPPKTYQALIEWPV